MQNVSLEHTVVTVNGHRAQGWANTADALQMPDLVLAEEAFGADGTLLASSTGMKGGAIILKFLANSPTAAFLFRQLASIQRGSVINFEATIENRQAGWRVNCARGFMKQAPLGQTLGNAVAPAREFTITFETIIPNYDGARTQSAPVAA